MQNLSYINVVLALLILYVVIKRQLEVFTKEQQVFIVSRHYAKKLKEELISVPRIEK